MKRLGKMILHALLALWMLEMIIDERTIHTYNKYFLDRGLADAEESTEETHSNRHLVELANYELLAGGFCADSAGYGYYGNLFLVDHVSDCASYCDTYPECVGFDFKSYIGICYIYFSDGDRPRSVLGSMIATEPPPESEGILIRGVGDIAGSDGKLYMASCFYRRRMRDDGIVHLDNYDNIGIGYCNDADGNGYSRLAYYLGSVGTTEDCAKKCDGFPGNLGFIWQAAEFLCMCEFNPEDLPYDPNDPKTLEAIPGACTSAGVSTPDSGECEIFSADGTSGYECHVHKNAPKCDAPVSAFNFRGGVSGDPLFMGLHGQVFKFEGRSGAWYSNVATKKLQWNLRFKEFETCPKDENMFVTGTTITLYELSSLPFKKPAVAHTISIMVADESKFFPGCQSGVCLGEGSLMIYVDGKMNISSPGDYQLGNNGGRIIAHNTFSACSRKWYDYVVPEMDVSEEEHGRLLDKKTPLEFLNDDKGEMLDPNRCTIWMKDRVRDRDLFSQTGGWSTIHIETPTISFHVEYRQDKNNCYSHSIDAWISEVSPVLLNEEWQGILGETRNPKFYLDKEPILSERSYLLSAKDDKDYEVEGPFGNAFTARKDSLGSSLS